MEMGKQMFGKQILAEPALTEGHRVTLMERASGPLGSSLSITLVHVPFGDL